MSFNLPVRSFHHSREIVENSPKTLLQGFVARILHSSGNERNEECDLAVCRKVRILRS